MLWVNLFYALTKTSDFEIDKISRHETYKQLSRFFLGGGASFRSVVVAYFASAPAISVRSWSFKCWLSRRQQYNFPAFIFLLCPLRNINVLIPHLTSSNVDIFFIWNYKQKRSEFLVTPFIACSWAMGPWLSTLWKDIVYKRRKEEVMSTKYLKQLYKGFKHTHTVTISSHVDNNSCYKRG